MAVHRNLTGADLHEPKGADTATTGKVYVSDGAGSGAWTTASSIITNTAFTTGDTKITLKQTADTSWIMGSAGSIGSGSSAATIRANADCEALFLFLHDLYSDAQCPVSGGRGISAAASWAANKRLTLPDMWGRAVGLAGAGTGLTSRAFSATTGTETMALATANLPAYTPSGTIAISLDARLTSGVWSSGAGVLGISAGAQYSVGGQTATATFTGVAQGGTATAFSQMQPTYFLNLMIKL